jgi:ABC-type branched-subunit amino acid transport system substrate-binding protein
VAGFDLSNCLLDPKAAINKAEKLGAKSFVLIPDANIDPCAFRNALKALRYNQGSYWTVGGDTLYTPALLQERELANNLVIGIHWHSLKSLNPEFAPAAAKLWKGRQVSWRTALAYDATRVLMVALQKRSPMNLIESFKAWLDPSIRRLHLQQTLKEPNFQVTGATGVISFAPTGDRNEPIGTLVKVVPSKCSGYGYKFVPLNYSTDPECVVK